MQRHHLLLRTLVVVVLSLLGGWFVIGTLAEIDKGMAAEDVSISSNRRRPFDSKIDNGGTDNVNNNSTSSVCTNNCSSHGKCISSNNCTCDAGYVGDDCSYEQRSQTVAFLFSFFMGML
jgi:hypothetical protein